MSNTAIYYSSGDEPDQVYWEHADGMVFHGGRAVSTKWDVAKVLAELKEFSLTPLFVRKDPNDKSIVSYVAEIDAPTGEYGVLHLKYYGERNSFWGHVSAKHENDLTLFLEKIFANIEEYEKVPEREDGVFLHYTFQGEYGPDTITREISAPNWGEVRENYAPSVQGKLQGIIEAHPRDLPGKVGIIHGPPRTGKTYWLRSLARAWSETAHITYVVDSREFFQDAGYMMRVLLDARHGKDIWHVLIFEDAEEYVTAAAKATVGPALSKLLNLGDGLLGQGLNILFLFTTNVTVDKLHEALTGPGRCFDVIEVPLLTQDQANRWLRDHGSKVLVSGDQPVGALYRILSKGEHDGGSAYDISAPYL